MRVPDDLFEFVAGDRLGRVLVEHFERGQVECIRAEKIITLPEDIGMAQIINFQ